MSVGEFANFLPYARSAGSETSGIWRAQAGQQWHARIQEQSADEGWTNEYAISGEIRWRNWTFELSGRIDQFLENDTQTRIREIKTVSRELPIPHSDAIQRFPHYFLQALAYGELWRAKKRNRPTPPDLELFLVEIRNGISQSLRITQKDEVLLSDHLDRSCDVLESKRQRLERLSNLAKRTAYPSPRPGQETIQADLQNAFDETPIVCVEAPTGYGKTGIAWEYALNRLASGQADRIIYLTSKSTGQIEAIARLEAMLAENSDATYWQIRNKSEHCINTEFRCSRESCQYIRDLDTKWESSGLDRLYALSKDTISIEQLREEGRNLGICPYEIMRSAIGLRDIWIGDLNYLFSPQSQRLLEAQIDYRPSKTFLIVDEAHNLPDRAKENYSIEIDARAVNFALSDFANTDSPRRCIQLFSALEHLVSRTDKGSVLSNPEQAELFGLLADIAESLANEALPYDTLSSETLDLVWLIASAARNWKDTLLPYFLWAPSNGVIKASCLDASPIIEQIVRRHNACLMLSATLTPFDAFSEACGLTLGLPAARFIQPKAPWRENAYTVAIDARVDTRLRQRERHYPLTARTIAVSARSNGPIIVFFPSYAYARKIKSIIDTEHFEIRVCIQEQGGSLVERGAFIEQSLQFNDALFLILGSSFSEAIDHLGGKTKLAIIVSPSLPEVTPIRKAELDRFDRKGQRGFEKAYLQPAIRKVNQALGRLVRAPEQTVKILLHCERFGQREIQNLLDPVCRSNRLILDEVELSQWLEE